MLITREMDYAVRIVRALHHLNQASATEIAKRENMPVAITYKMLGALLKAKVVKSIRGVNGGYYLTHPTSTFTLYDLFGAIDNSLYITECMLSGHECPNNRAGQCKTHKEYLRIQNIVKEEFQKTTLDKLC